jgi:hypothetical protein
LKVVVPNTPRLDILVILSVTSLSIQALPALSIAMQLGPLMLLPLNWIARVKSFGAAPSAGANGGVGKTTLNSADTLAAGLCAILIAAVAVSVAVVPVDPLDVASANSVEHAVDVGPVEFTHAARMFASVFTVVCGTVPVPDGVVASAAPVEIPARFVAFAKAFAIPVCASAVPELDTCVASVANPANAYAAAIVDTSSANTNGVAVAKFPVLGQVPSAASSPAAEFIPAPGLPPSAYT